MTEIDLPATSDPTADGERVEGLDALQGAIAELAESARQEVLILSADLQAHLYDQAPFLAAVRRLATSGGRASIRVLVRDVDPAIKNGHRLVELARRLTSFIEIRRLAVQDVNLETCFMLVDRRAFLWQPTSAGRAARLARQARRQGRDLAQLFQEYWDRSESDPNLRRLWL